MSLNLEIKYAGRINAASGGYPYGSVRNETSQGADDGTLVDEAWANDIYGFLYSLLDSEGITPNNIPDQVGASQFFTALESLVDKRTKYKISSNAASSVTYNSSNHRAFETLTSASPITVTVEAATAPYGDCITIEKGVGSADITINGDTGIDVDPIDGGTNVLDTDGQVVSLVSKSATKWRLIK